MKKIFLVLILVLLLFSCKTRMDKTNDPTKMELSNNMPEDVLRAQVKALFEYVEDRIARGDYQEWYNSISDEYKRFLNDRSNLDYLSEMSDFLYNRKIKLKNPKDYFLYVVMQVRAGKKARFRDYKYIDKKHIKVICSFDNEGNFEYNFIYENGSWKIDR